MKYVDFQFNNGKTLKLKVKMAEHLEYARKGRIVVPEVPVVASEAVKAEADAIGVDLAKIEGTGKDGRILKRDLREYSTRMMQAG